MVKPRIETRLIRVSAGLLMALTIAATGVVRTGDARAATPVLAATPYMGWNTYYGVGGVFNQQTIISVAESMLHRGLARAGYRIVWLDFGWAAGSETPPAS